MKAAILTLPGDGIGPEIISAAKRVLDAVANRFGHEFVCTDTDGGRCIIYVSAETGEQEKILLLLEDENGSLTI